VNMGRERFAWRRARSTTPRRTLPEYVPQTGVSKSRHSIANFKLREGQPSVCRVTLRRMRCMSFFDRLVATALPRIRDFRGLSTAVVSMGVEIIRSASRTQTIFPEIELDKIKTAAGHGYHHR